METTKIPAPGTKLRCITNQDRPELTVGKVYTVAPMAFLDKMPINYARFQPDNFAFVAIDMPGQSEKGIFPVGIFEIA